jgi:hypothetical protein
MIFCDFCVGCIWWWLEQKPIYWKMWSWSWTAKSSVWVMKRFHLGGGCFMDETCIVDIFVLSFLCGIFDRKFVVLIGCETRSDSVHVYFLGEGTTLHLFVSNLKFCYSVFGLSFPYVIWHFLHENVIKRTRKMVVLAGNKNRVMICSWSYPCVGLPICIELINDNGASHPVIAMVVLKISSMDKYYHMHSPHRRKVLQKTDIPYFSISLLRPRCCTGM